MRDGQVLLFSDVMADILVNEQLFERLLSALDMDIAQDAGDLTARRALLEEGRRALNLPPHELEAVQDAASLPRLPRRHEDPGPPGGPG